MPPAPWNPWGWLWRPCYEGLCAGLAPALPLPGRSAQSGNLSLVSQGLGSWIRQRLQTWAAGATQCSGSKIPSALLMAPQWSSGHLCSCFQCIWVFPKA